jgi:hypothetical protein
MSFYPLSIFQSSLTIAKILDQLLVNPLQIFLPIMSSIMPFTIPTMHEVFHLLFCISSFPPLMFIIVYYNNLLKKGVQAQ